MTLPPFEMALRDGGARSIIRSTTNRRRTRPADPSLLTELLRETQGSPAQSSDYFGVGFLESLRVAEAGDAARLALTAGVDVELPSVRSYGDALVAAVRAGLVPRNWWTAPRGS